MFENYSVTYGMNRKRFREYCKTKVRNQYKQNKNGRTLS